MIAGRPPEHMDRWTRNERLYRHLLGMGLVAIPIFVGEDRTRIDHLLVTTELPFAAKDVLGSVSTQVSACSPQSGEGA